jgi:uncharacterized GH25 family protein
MRVAALIPWWFRSGDPRPSDEIEEDVRAELEFHLYELADELQQQGHQESEARRLAAERFGNVDAYVRECQRIKKGDQIVLQRILVATSLALVVFVGLLAWRTFALSADQQYLIAQLQQTQAELANLREPQRESVSLPPTTAVTGRVLTKEGEPIANAHLLATYKTWPGGRYQQESLQATSSDSGEFTLPMELPTSDQHALQLSVVADGYAFESLYEMNPSDGLKQLPPFNFRLAKATPLRVQLLDSDGNGVANAEVFLQQRTTAEGAEHGLYFQGSEAVHQRTDADGLVTLATSVAGDHVIVLARAPGEDWQEFDAKVREDMEPLVLTLTSSADRSLGSRQ